MQYKGSPREKYLPSHHKRFRFNLIFFYLKERKKKKRKERDEKEKVGEEEQSRIKMVWLAVGARNLIWYDLPVFADLSAARKEEEEEKSK